MKKRILFSIVILATLQPLTAQLLWEISGRGAKTSYLFGTHDWVSADYLDSIVGIYTAFNSCSQVVGEVALSDPLLIEAITQASLLPDGSFLGDLMSREELLQVDSALQVLTGLSLNDFGKLKPSVINSIYLLALYDKIYPRQDDFQLDSYFQQVALQQGIMIKSLENGMQQIDFLGSNKTLKKQASLLVNTIEHTDQVIEQIKQINYLYRLGDLDGLLDFYQKDTIIYVSTLREQHQRLDERSSRWVPIIADYIKEEPSFIVVDIRHLPGDNGLITLLRKAGYRVKPVGENGKSNKKAIFY